MPYTTFIDPYAGAGGPPINCPECPSVNTALATWNVLFTLHRILNLRVKKIGLINVSPSPHGGLIEIDKTI